MLRSGWIRVLGVALLTLAWAGRAQAGTCITLPPWNTPGPGSPMGAAVYGHAVTSAGGYVYSASGASGAPPNAGGDVTLFQRYNPASNAWELLPNVPTPVVGASLAYDAAGGRLFLFGGANSATGIGNLVQIYTISPPPGSWSTGPPMPGSRAGMGSGVIGNSVYLVGGFSTTTTVESQNWAFDPTSSTYTLRAPLPSPRARAGSAVTGNKVYVISGQDSAGGLANTNCAYTPAGDSWDCNLAVIPTPVWAPGSTALGAMTPECHGDILIVGGGTPLVDGQALMGDSARVPSSTNISQIYDVATNSWSTNGLPLLSTARFGLRAAQAGDTLIAFGGWNGSSNVTTVDRIQGPPLPVQLQSFRVE
jgi:hypothetical protein